MALAVNAADGARTQSHRRLAARRLRCSALAFAGIKLTEYAIDFSDHLVPVARLRVRAGRACQGAQVFFWIYFAATGLHLVHLSIGIVIVLRSLSAPGGRAAPGSVRRSSAAGCTGTSSTSCGSSSTRCFISCRAT